jgi:hypothetical protein
MMAIVGREAQLAVAVGFIALAKLTMPSGPASYPVLTLLDDACNAIADLP